MFTDWRKKENIFVCRCMNVYVGSPKEITKKQTNNKTLLELKSEYKKLEGYKVDVKKVQLLSYIPAMN